MESTGTNGEEPGIIREKMSADLIGAFKKVANTAIYRLALFEMTRQVMTRHFMLTFHSKQF